MRRLPTLLEAPFVVSSSVFVNPRYRGTRLPAGDDPTTLKRAGEMFLRKQIRVHDARSLAPAPSLEREGFHLIEAPILLDFGNREVVTTRFYDYCEDLVKAATGCLFAKTVQHEFRTGPAGKTAYAPRVHADVCPYIEDVMDVPDGRHFGLFNVWRSTDLHRQIEFMPLALCDVTTVAVADIVYADAWRRTETPTRLVDCRLIHDVAQSWHYFPLMTPDEALIFRQYDSRREDANLRATFHTAFEDPTTRAGAPLRHSVEARVLAVFREQDTERAHRRARFQAEVPKIHRDGSFAAWRHENMLDWDGERESG